MEELKLANFRKQICDKINENDLPIDAKYFVLKDILLEIESIYRYNLSSSLSQIEKKDVKIDLTNEDSVSKLKNLITKNNVNTIMSALGGIDKKDEAE